MSSARTEQRSPSPFRFSRRRALLTALVAVVLAAGAIALIGHLADYGQLRKAFDEADNSWFPVALLGEVVAYLGYILAYHDIARINGGPRLDYWTVTRVVAIGFGAFVVGSAPGGLAVDFWALNRAGVEKHEAARRVLALNTLEWAALSTFAVASGCAVLLGFGEAPLAMTLAWLIVVPACAIAAFYVSAPSRADRFSRLPSRRSRPKDGSTRDWARWVVAKLRVALADAIGGVVIVRQILAAPWRYPAGVLGFPVYWVGDIIAVYASVRAFGGEIGVAPLVLAYTTAKVATALPLPAGGSGGIEASLAMTLHLVGVPLAPALLGAVLYRVFSFWLPIGFAVAFLPMLPQLNEDLPRKARTAAASAAPAR